jgi:predicted metal-binding protein
MINRIWSKLKDGPGFEDCVMVELVPPKTDINTISTCRRLCKQNLCGEYNNNWGCPPGVGDIQECMDLANQYRHAALVYRRFCNIDMSDRSKIIQCETEHQEVCRRLANALRKEGTDVLPLAASGCRYCDKCTCPSDPCKYPEQMVPSISAYGIVMEEYLGNQNIRFKMEKDAFTLYGLLLYR